MSRHASPVKSGPDDAAFFRESFEQNAFATLYNRKKPWRGDLAKALGHSCLSHFEGSGSIHWTVLDNRQRPVGLAINGWASCLQVCCLLARTAGRGACGH